MDSNYQTNFNAPHFISSLSTPMSATSTIAQTPTTAQSMMNYARMPHRYTTTTLLSLRPPMEITIFPDHLVEQRFLDEENYIDLDRMLGEKAGKFDLESYNMTEGPLIMPSRIHKYDFSDPTVIEKVKNRRPKDPLTPQQVAALTSVATRHQSSTLLFPYQTQPSHVWIDDYSHQQVQLNSSRHHFPPQPSMPYQRQNPNQCEIYTNQIKSLLPTYQTIPEEKTDETNTIPILQRLFQAQHIQQNEQRKIDPFHIPDISAHQQGGLSAFCTPATPAKPNSNKTFEWLCTPDQNQKNVLAQLLKCSTTMETPGTPSFDIHRMNKAAQMNKEDEDAQNFYSAPPSPTQQHDSSLSLFSTVLQSQSLENWFGSSIYTKAYPRMPSDRVLSACDLEQ
ncbi:unnamed protein product [Adineta steineri]|uniref:Uncharacterized protein n=1 Tax=Adineta steineri TaxID=433720 RepID=A0A813NGB3_9BILA|nr:unnamed protein product [Adineta steineri]CAF4279491.1 unnamed protein product [Adineta steineri]